MWEVWMCKIPDLIEQEYGKDFHGPIFVSILALYNQDCFLRIEPSCFPQPLVMLVNRCFSKVVDDRPSFSEIANMKLWTSLGQQN
eukprot:m.139307 g.139307  ORF g.139307 m.139307 type:complete len:85 (-) comp20855_c0_seq1:92-346(-)